MGVGCRGRGGRRGGAGRHHHRNVHHQNRHHHHHRNVHHQNRHHHHHRNVHHQNRRTTPLSSNVVSSNQSIAIAPYRLLVIFGVIFSLPGTFLTCLEITVPGSVILGIANLILIKSTILAFIYDWKRNVAMCNFRGKNNWNERVRFDAKLLSFLWLPIGLALACTGFVQYSRHPLAIAGCSIIGLAIVVLLVGLILGHYLDFEEMTDGTSQPHISTAGETNRPSPTPADIESNPDSIPSISANTSNPTNNTASSVSSEGSNISYEQLLSDLQVFGTFLYIPGVCFSCIGWIRYEDRVVAGTLGAILLCIGGMMILISAFMVFRKANDVSEKRSLITKIVIMFFVSGVPLTAVGFTHLQPGLALGIVGVCLTGLSLISYLIIKCCYKQEQTELTSSVNVVPMSQNVNVQNRTESGYPPVSSNDPAFPGPHPGYPTYAGSEMPNPAFPGTYPPYPQGSSPDHQVFPSAAGINPAYPPAMYGPSQSAPPTAQSADNDLPSYKESKDMTSPSFQVPDIPYLPPVEYPNKDLEANKGSEDMATPSFQPPYIPSAPLEESSNTDQENIAPLQQVIEDDLQPPPSYDEVVKSGSNDTG